MKKTNRKPKWMDWVRRAPRCSTLVVPTPTPALQPTPFQTPPSKLPPPNFPPYQALHVIRQPSLRSIRFFDSHAARFEPKSLSYLGGKVPACDHVHSTPREFIGRPP